MKKYELVEATKHYDSLKEAIQDADTIYMKYQASRHTPTHFAVLREADSTFTICGLNHYYHIAKSDVIMVYNTKTGKCITMYGK